MPDETNETNDHKSRPSTARFNADESKTLLDALYTSSEYKSFFQSDSMEVFESKQAASLRKIELRLKHIIDKSNSK